MCRSLGDTVFAVARRLDIELTSDRGDGHWTWRAVGAKLPKGVVEAELLPSEAAVGDVLKVEAEADLDGLVISAVFSPKGPRKETARLELLGSGRDEPLVTQVLAPKGRGRGRDRSTEDRGRGRGRGRDRDDQARGRDRDDGGRSRGRNGRDGERRGSSDRPRRERPKPPARPKTPRLRPARSHRNAALKALPKAQQQLAEDVLRGGVPGVRQTIDRMNEMAAAEGMPKIKREPLVALAEKLAPTLKAAEWRDRAEAAVVGIETIDLRDIRSVVAAADGAARDEETRKLAEQLRAGLNVRTEADHQAWRDELAQNLAEGSHSPGPSPEFAPTKGRRASAARHGRAARFCGVPNLSRTRSPQIAGLSSWRPWRSLRSGHRLRPRESRRLRATSC